MRSRPSARAKTPTPGRAATAGACTARRVRRFDLERARHAPRRARWSAPHDGAQALVRRRRSAGRSRARARRRDRHDVTLGERRWSLDGLRAAANASASSRPKARRGATQIDPIAHAGDGAAEGGRLTAPMPGKVIAFLAAGRATRSSTGQPLAVMEAMKMEHTIAAPRDGTVEELLYAVGDQVAEGGELLRLDGRREWRQDRQRALRASLPSARSTAAASASADARRSLRRQVERARQAEARGVARPGGVLRRGAPDAVAGRLASASALGGRWNCARQRDQFARRPTRRRPTAPRAHRPRPSAGARRRRPRRSGAAAQSGCGSRVRRRMLRVHAVLPV